MLRLGVTPLASQGQKRVPMAAGYAARDLNKRDRYIKVVKRLL